MSDYAKQFHVREWINGLRDDDLHDIGRAWDAAFRERGPGRMKAEASVRAALFRYAPEWGQSTRDANAGALAVSEPAGAQPSHPIRLSALRARVQEIVDAGRPLTPWDVAQIITLAEQAAQPCGGANAK